MSVAVDVESSVDRSLCLAVSSTLAKRRVYPSIRDLEMMHKGCGCIRDAESTVKVPLLSHNYNNYSKAVNLPKL